jgi:cyclophilin family peptidyl-prolyl cis-trans isomerase
LRARGLVALLLCLGLVATACGGSGKDSASPPKAGADGCDHSKPAAASEKRGTFSKPDTVLDPGEKAEIDMVTSCGDLKIQLDTDKANPIPNSVAFLVRKKFYDGLTFHRIITDFVLQGGDPNGNGTGGPGYEVVGTPPRDYRYRLGDLAMAKTGMAPAGASGSQFFVISGPSGQGLPPEYGILGHAGDEESLATIRAIDALGVRDGPPSEPVLIESMRLEEIA